MKPLSIGTIPSMAVVIPAFRAEKYILKILAGIPQFVSFIIVVDDCSPDRTAELVQTCLDSRVHLVSHNKNKGVGAAVITGYSKAIELGAKIIVKMDSDDQMDPKFIIPLIAPILMGQADYTKGNRFLHLNELQSMPVIRRVGNAGLSFLTKAASGYWNIFDPTNGYTAIHASIIPMMDPKRLHRRYFFETSVLIELGLIRAVIQDVQIPAKYQDEVSSLSEWKALFEFPPQLIIGFLRRLLTQYFIRDFGVFSISLIFGLGFNTFGFFFGLYHWYYSSITKTTASTGTVMLAVLPFILGWHLLIECLTLDIQNIPKDSVHHDIDFLEKLYQGLSE